MRALVLGGTGFLGAALCRRLVADGHTVTSVSRTPPRPDVLPPEVTVRLADAAHLDDAGLRELVGGQDWVVYGIGPDDRGSMGPDAAAFLTHELVEPTERMARACRDAGVRCLLLLGSYFASGGRADPAFRARHPYVHARLTQHERAVAAGGDDLTVCTLEIPYVFGVQPGTRAVWRGAYDAIARVPVLPRVDGGTSAATLDSVVDAAAALLEQGRHGGSYPVTDGELHWNRWMELAREELGLPVRFVPWPRVLTDAVGAGLLLGQRLRRHQAGLQASRLGSDVVHTHRIVDGAATRAEFDLPNRSGDLENQIRATVRAVRDANDPH
ncbi:NAD-dependent epimerase/dehydratase family protein [Propioniciclava soli]|uniref:NAD-dependent epimerase/dehydratase family protein n=1 Tax=Propioniciclava soli TaxID=2775081 RepID=UPI001E308DFD